MKNSVALKSRMKWMLLILAGLFSIAVLGYYIAIEKSGLRREASNAFVRLQTKTETGGAPAAAAHAKPAEFPREAGMREMARSGSLALLADPHTGHFQVRDETTGSVWRSYPNPRGWTEDGVTATWKSRLLAPFMVRYIEQGTNQELDQMTDWFTEGGRMTALKPIKSGYRVRYDLDRLELAMTVEIVLKDGYVEIRIPPDGLTDSSEYFTPISVRLFPFFGAETSDNEGYLFIPDGSGALIDFRENQPGTVGYYEERIYGEDRALSYNQDASVRLPIQWPVFGIRTAGQAFAAVIHQGAEYASLLAAPARSFNAYNWITAEHLLRLQYFQPTTTARDKGVYVYADENIRKERSTRYYLLSGGQPEYAEMAAAFRRYLMEEIGLSRLPHDVSPVPLHLSLLGADISKGFWHNRDLPLTTTDQALDIVKELSALGVEAMNVIYKGWERDGYSRYGAQFPVNAAIGGDSGMKRFAQYARGKEINVLLESTGYAYNSTGAGGFRRSRDAIRDPGSTVIDAVTETGVTASLVGPDQVHDDIIRDLAKASELGISGLLFGERDGLKLDSDYNSRRPVSRERAIALKRDAFRQTAEALGLAAASVGAMYVADIVTHLDGLRADYSYDMFVSRAVPFVQIALHGLLTYSMDYANLSTDYRRLFLKGIEYGAEPSFLITYEPTERWLRSQSLSAMHSTSYEQWRIEIVTMYQRYNEALGQVRNAFITGHRQLASGVYETTYDNGIRVVVNYNDEDYAADGRIVKAADFIVRGGAG